MRNLPRSIVALSLAAVATLATLGVGTADAASVSVWDRVAKCESSGNWKIDTGNGYSGGLQIKHSTWRGNGGSAYAPIAAGATKSQQIAVAQKILSKQGWRAWPVCSRKAGMR